MLGSATVLSNLEHRIFDAITKLRASNSDFSEAYDGYTTEHGSDVIAVNEPLKISGTIDPVVLILGRTCAIYYKDSAGELSSSLGSFRLGNDRVCIIGRRQSFDSKLIAWSPSDNMELELGTYNPLSGILPSRIHGAIVTSSRGEALYTDLCSSSGTIVVGEREHGQPFVRVFDAGTPRYPMIRFERTSMSRKS